MKKSAATTLLPAILLGVMLVVCAVSTVEAAGTPNIVVVLTGTTVGEMRMVGGTMQNCFDVELVDPASERIVGSGTDCLDLGSIVPIGDDGGFAIDNTTLFHLPSGTIASLSRTTIQPVENAGVGATHVTGEVNESDNILSDLSTGRFAGATGRTRLSGIVDLTELMTNNIISFDCMFVIDLN